MRKKFFLISVPVALLVIVLGFLLYHFVRVKQLKVFSYDQEVFMTYTWGYTFTAIKDKNFLKQGGNLHLLNLGRIAFFLIKDGKESNNQEEIVLGKEYLDFLADSYPFTFENDRIKIWKYQFQWGELKPGWYSGMANSAIALAFLAGYEIFGEEKYRNLAEKAINGVVEPVERGGCTIPMGPDTYWFEEYVCDGMKKENAGFVLNGFLFSLETVKIFADVTGNPYYASRYRSGLESLKNIHENYYYPKKDWTYYALNPKIIESPHYAIYDLILFNALYRLTNDNFFLNEINVRKDIMAKNYPLDICVDDNNQFRYVFSAIGLPHPYWVDIYPIELNFLNIKNQIVKKEKLECPRNLAIPTKDRVFIFNKLDNEIVNYEIYSTYEKDNFQWAKLPITKNKKKCKTDPRRLNYDFVCGYDAKRVENSNLITIDPSYMNKPDDPEHYSNNQGTVTLVPANSIDRRKYKYFGLMLQPQKDIKSIKISIFDSQGGGTNRYYEPLKAGAKNLLLLQWLGFKNVEELNDNISQIILIIYTKEYQSDEKFSIKMEDLLLFEDNIELYNYFINNSFYFPENMKKGNIY
jgi:hypothetical protein